MSALQRLPATRVAPIVLAFQIAVPVIVVAAVGGEDWGATPLGGAVLAAGWWRSPPGPSSWLPGRRSRRSSPRLRQDLRRGTRDPVSERSGSGRWASARRSAASSSARVVATSARPKRR
jgi:hypothetical protein